MSVLADWMPMLQEREPGERQKMSGLADWMPVLQERETDKSQRVRISIQTLWRGMQPNTVPDACQ